MEGIFKWWLADRGNWTRREVLAAVDSLTVRGWVKKGRKASSEEFYGIDTDRIGEIRSFLRQHDEI
jgi:hypothetical protein